MQQEGKKGILTMGGAFSNHLAATAFLCHQLKISSAAIIRGEKPEKLSHTLTACRDRGMQLLFSNRSSFDPQSNEVEQIKNKFPDYYFVPPGGDNEAGETGAGEMPLAIDYWENYEAVICATGTGTTLRGIHKKIQSHQRLYGMVALRIPATQQTTFIENNQSKDSANAPRFYFNAAGKGFGRPDPDLFELMNEFYRQTQIPTDFVYTAKAIKGLLDLLDQNIIPAHSQTLLIHTGGLQGNDSLEEGQLHF